MPCAPTDMGELQAHADSRMCSVYISQGPASKTTFFQHDAVRMQFACTSKTGQCWLALTLCRAQKGMPLQRDVLSSCLSER